MVKAIIVLDKGLKEVVKREIEELLNEEVSNKAGKTYNKIDFKELILNKQNCLLFDSSFREFLRLFLYLRSGENVFIGFERNEIKEELNGNNSGKLTINRLLKYLGNNEYSFKCLIKGHTAQREKIKDILSFFSRFNISGELKNPDFYVYLLKYNTQKHDAKELLVLDFGRLSKRAYRIFNHSRTIRANIVYSLIRIGGLKDNFKGKIVDLSSISACAIESALFLKREPNRIESCITDFLTEISVEDKVKRRKDNKENNKLKSSEIYSLSWNPRILNLMRKNSSISKTNKDIKFLSGEIKKLLIEIGKVDIVFCQFIFINYKFIGEILNILKTNLEKNGTVIFVFDKKISQNQLWSSLGCSSDKNSNLILSERIVFQGERKLFVCIIKKRK